MNFKHLLAVIILSTPLAVLADETKVDDVADPQVKAEAVQSGPALESTPDVTEEEHNLMESFVAWWETRFGDGEEGGELSELEIDGKSEEK